jgi:hypothetical protein
MLQNHMIMLVPMIDEPLSVCMLAARGCTAVHLEGTRFRRSNATCLDGLAVLDDAEVRIRERSSATDDEQALCWQARASACRAELLWRTVRDDGLCPTTLPQQDEWSVRLYLAHGGHSLSAARHAVRASMGCPVVRAKRGQSGRGQGRDPVALALLRRCRAGSGPARERTRCWCWAATRPGSGNRPRRSVCPCAGPAGAALAAASLVAQAGRLGRPRRGVGRPQPLSRGRGPSLLHSLQNTEVCNWPCV